MRSLLFSADQDILHHQHIHIRTEVAVQGFFGPVYNGFIFVE